MKKLTLFDYLELTEGDEITVTDNTYDTETYFYKYEKSEEIDIWDESIKKLSQLLTVKKIHSHAIAVNLSDIIEKKIEELKQAELFIDCDIDSIMDDIDNILSGNVSEKWMEKFVNVLSN